MGMTAPIEVRAVFNDSLTPKEVVVGVARSMFQAVSICQNLHGLVPVFGHTILTGNKGETNRQWRVLVQRPEPKNEGGLS